MRNVQRGFLDLSEVDRFEVTPEEYARLRLLPGDLLIVEGNGSVDQIGRNALFTDAGGEWIHQNHIIRVRVNQEIALPGFLSQYLNCDLGIRQMIEKARSTSGLYTLSTRRVAALEIPIPSIAAQKRVVSALANQLAQAERLTHAADAELSEMRNLPTALLRQALSRDPRRGV